MHRIDTPTAQRDKFGEGKNGFTRGNPQTGTPATQLDYLYCDAIQEEIANAIELLAGIKLDKSKHDQLATAIKEFVSKGNVKLSSAIDSVSENDAATSFAVKKAYDVANEAVKRSGDNMTGELYINGQPVLKSGDYGIGSFTGAQLDNPDDTLKGGCYATRSNAFTELTEYKNRSDSSSLTAYPAWSKNWYVEKLAVVYSKTPRIYYRCATPEGKQQFYESITTANISNYIPVGVPLPYPSNKPPVGWFECNGSTFDKNKFPKLAAAYPSGKLPDLRGEFVRGWDNGKGVDPNRGMLSWQNDAIRNIYGEISPISETFGAAHVATGAFQYFEKHSDHTPTIIDRGLAGGVTFDASRIVPTANENRPRNVAFMYIVKAE